MTKEIETGRKERRQAEDKASFFALMQSMNAWRNALMVACVRSNADIMKVNKSHVLSA